MVTNKTEYPNNMDSTCVKENEGIGPTQLHKSFYELRCKLNTVNSRVKSIITVLSGDSNRESIGDCQSCSPEIPPHEMGLKSNFECLEDKINDTINMIDTIYAIIGMDQGAIYN